MGQHASLRGWSVLHAPPPTPPPRAHPLFPPPCFVHTLFHLLFLFSSDEPFPENIVKSLSSPTRRYLHIPLKAGESFHRARQAYMMMHPFLCEVTIGTDTCIGSLRFK